MTSVVWFEGIAGLDKYSAQFAAEGLQGRSRYACCGLLNDMFDSYDCRHYSGWDGMPSVPEYAVIIIHGGHLRKIVDQINEKIQQLQAVVCIGIGDEENDFPYDQLWHRNMKLWVQSPIPGKSRADHFPIVGYPCDIHDHIRIEELPNILTCPRPLDWSFAGQVTHVRREECVAQLRRLPNGRLLETQQFYSGMEHGEYFRTLIESKVIPCPSGPVCSDTFRLAEALEAGCIPIIDERPGWKDNHPRGFWDMVFPQGYPFPLLQNWSELPPVMDRLLADYDNQSRICREWWASYKADYYSWLGKDFKALGINL